MKLEENNSLQFRRKCENRVDMGEADMVETCS